MDCMCYLPLGILGVQVGGEGEGEGGDQRTRSCMSGKSRIFFLHYAKSVNRFPCPVIHPSINPMSSCPLDLVPQKGEIVLAAFLTKFT